MLSSCSTLNPYHHSFMYDIKYVFQFLYFSYIHINKRNVYFTVSLKRVPNGMVVIIPKQKLLLIRIYEVILDPPKIPIKITRKFTTKCQILLITDVYTIRIVKQLTMPRQLAITVNLRNQKCHTGSSIYQRLVCKMEERPCVYFLKISI